MVSRQSPARSRDLKANMKIKHVVVAALYVAVGIPLILIVWTKAAQLLSVRSDASLWLGCALIAATLAFLGLSAFLLWRRFFEEGLAQGNRRFLQPGASHKRLFPESANSGEKIDEQNINHRERSYERDSNQ
jgi:hypothetical protein